MKGQARRPNIASLFAILAVLVGRSALAINFDIDNTPLFVSNGVAPLALLVMGRDHKLYYEAYNDASDLDGDGVLDVRYKPDTIDYFGYFDSHKCYEYDSGRFKPDYVTANKRCSGEWSGDFLNYLTTSRMDALRKVLYGGLRSTDTSTATTLERSYIPQDAHSWGKEYTSPAVDGYNISHYAPLNQPNAGTRHLFASTTPSGQTLPRLRVLQNRVERIWQWVSKDSPVSGTQIRNNADTADLNVTPRDLTVRVDVCKAGLLEENCQLYPNGKYKPVGLLQQYGENESMYFGLLTGSYAKNMSGGVLRKSIGPIANEINPATGQFLNTASNIVQTLDNLRIAEFNGTDYNPGWSGAWITTREMHEGEQPDWGNPIGEMMYEGLRYLAGKGSPTGAFSISAGANPDASLGLPVATWDNPYANYPRCAKPIQLVISDINPSYDSDQVPGSAFAGFGGDVSGLDCRAEADAISGHEADVAGLHFIGQSGGTVDGAPSAKNVTSLGSIRGLSPEEPTKLGSYYSASVAYYGHVNDINPVADQQTMDTFAVALASPLPRIEIDADGQTVQLVPYAKSVGGCSHIWPDPWPFQPTNQIVDFYVESIGPNSGRFRVNFEDVAQGADHDMDAIAIYEYTVNADNSIDVRVTADFASGCIVQHLGYVISGTTRDGAYLEVTDGDTPNKQDRDYHGDTPPGCWAGDAGCWADGRDLPGGTRAAPFDGTTRRFTPGTSSSATLLKDPLWYAAKWGGFLDGEGGANPKDDLPQGTEWDEDGDGQPDTYFLVTNAGQLQNQLGKAFFEIIDRKGSASTVAINSGSISSSSAIYQALFRSGSWSGQLQAYPINMDGTLGSVTWDAGDLIPAADLRKIITWDGSDGVPFRWDEITADMQSALGSEDVLNYVRGDRSNELSNGGAMRDRSTLLGDIVHSAPIYVGESVYRYPNNWGTGAAENAHPHSSFRASVASRMRMVYTGANDGMLHGFDARTGVERVAYVPSPVLANLPELSTPNYTHRYFVDGAPVVVDAFFDGGWHTVLASGLGAGGQGLFALDVTNPTSGFSTESVAANKVLWEFTDKDDADLGFTFARPSIVRLPNGRWGAIFGNGYNNTVNDDRDGLVTHSSTGNAVLYIKEYGAGGVVRKIDTGVGASADPLGQSRPNGLSTPAPVDVNGDSIVDYVYAGDLFGNLWKFDLTSSSPGSWSLAYGSTPLFKACAGNTCSGSNSQAITTQPQVGRHPTGVGYMVFFGTGKYFESGDGTATGQTTQSFYGIWDKNETSLTAFDRRHLLPQQIVQEFSDVSGIEYRVTSDNAMIWHTGPGLPSSGGYLGWYMDLYNTDANTNNYGERQISDAVLRNGRIIFTTLIPSEDPCEFGGDSWLMELDADSGSRLPYTPFDRNADGDFNEQDYAIDPAGLNPDGVSTSGKKSTVGITPTPGIIASPEGDKEYKYSSGSGSASGQLIETTVENPGPGATGRQSWQELEFQ